MGKFVALHRYLLDMDILREQAVVEPGMVDFANLCSIHTPRYATAVWDGTLTRKEQRRMGLPWSRSLAVRSRLAVQGTINAGLMALQDGIAGNLAGGTHHAMPDLGEGFCVYNDVAVAIKVLKQAMWVRNVLVIDCDVHQGNGTAEIFKNDENVFTFSIHGEKNYPFKKPPSSLDVGMPDKTGDLSYIHALSDALDDIYSSFKPDLIFYLAGIDPLETDHFGRLSLTMNGLIEREHLVISSAMDQNIPITLLLSGGYAPTVEKTAEAHAILYKTAKELYRNGYQ
jgi:acetoin utilization deacetylase AcuC-like enzyme